MSQEVGKRLGLQLSNPLLLTQALTHRSYLNENRHWPTGHYERLEFLGDAVLDLILAEFLFREFPNKPEGELTADRAKVVSDIALAKIGEALNLFDDIYMSRGEKSSMTARGRERILACVIEAIIGALYIEQGYQAANKFASRVILSSLPAVLESAQDPKSTLQQKVQALLRLTPTYQVLEQSGPDHNKRFIVGVYFGSTLVAKGHGPAKKHAEEKAAEAALLIKGWA